MSQTILIVEDDAVLRRVIQRFLSKAGWDVHEASSIAEGEAHLAERSPDVILTDITLPDGFGFEFIQRLATGPDSPSVIVMTGDGSLDNAVAAIRNRVADFLVKPFSLDALEGALLRIRQARDATQSTRALVAAAVPPDVRDWRRHYAPYVIGSATSLLKIFGIIERVADTDCSVLITGESGTGKELVARAVHAASTRRDGPFVTVNCAAIPDNLLESELFGHAKGAFTGASAARIGRFTAADGGTIFLDEIGEMSLPLQAKILRLLQEKEVTPLGETRTRRVDVRVVAATNRNLELMIEEKTFREDLLYRLNVIPIELPALRHRAEDVPELVTYFIGRANERRARSISGIEPRAMDALKAYHWPGNIRQLENTIERIVVLRSEGEISYDDLPEAIRSRPPAPRSTDDEPVLPPDGLDLREAVDRYETALIRQALERSGGNRNRAAALLQMNRTTLVEKLKKKDLLSRATPDGDDVG